MTKQPAQYSLFFAGMFNSIILIECFVFFVLRSYHQKYYLQSHKKLAEALSLDAKLLQSSHVAARLNGYLVGVGGVKQYLDEATLLGLTGTQIDYVQHYVQENEGGALYC